MWIVNPAKYSLGNFHGNGCEVTTKRRACAPHCPRTSDIIFNHSYVLYDATDQPEGFKTKTNGKANGYTFGSLIK